MHVRPFGGRSARMLGAALVAAGALAGTQGNVPASASVTWTSVPPVSPGEENLLTSVIVLSSSNVWAAGWYNNDPGVYGLIEHWDGTAWTQVPSPNPGGAAGTDIWGLRAVSASDIWAVGTYRGSDSTYQTLILHWDGNAWSRVPSPNPAGATGENQLFGVTAPSAANAWAVGEYRASGSKEKTLVLVRHARREESYVGRRLA